MKLIALGDTHGRIDWKTITAKNDFDTVIFIGDYFDTHENISAQQQKENFKDIIAYKRANIDKVVLLIGNHDFHYLRSINETYSGFQEWHKTDIQELLHEALNDGLMQMCYVHDKYVFSHAGITKTWCDNNFTFSKNFKLPELVNAINDKFQYQPQAFKFKSGVNCSPYGDDICQTPIWVRPESLLQDGIDDCVQVVGHTTQNSLVINDKIILIDTIGTSAQYLQIEDGIISACNSR